ncbi:ATP-binding protein [Sphingomonas montanisoli]|uniref:histidine kinase n=1 Tax=Sphingomonas montanisoli TaxID=2606412 RepID=A0A5D9C8W3_9SPHN|nr:ATP-binding protein [Sphingomonas montanisoli]TZG27816.1 HAMP domain-containing protein [Sphingomonas montanisoli]
MRHFVRPSLTLAGRILVILLLTITVEFCTSTMLYERASQFSLREDEAHRLAEHLVVTRKLISERPTRERPAIARLLTTDRYDVRWGPSLPPPPPLAAELGDMQRQIVAWEPTLAAANLRLKLSSPGRNTVVTGGLTLPDGTWLYFGMHEVQTGWDLALGRILLALVPAVGLMLIGGLLIRQTLRPMKMLGDAAGRIGFGEWTPLPETGSGEVLRVIRAFNAMQARIHRLIADRTQALAAVGHDLRTPIARLQLRIDTLSDPTTRDAMHDDASEMEGMVASLLAYLGGESDPEPRARVDVAIMTETIVDDLADQGHRIRYEGPETLEAMVRPVDLKRALGNLANNALHYGRNVQISLEREGEVMRFRVSDDGPGIPEARLAEALEPFVRLDPARGRNTKGLGLGLAIVKRIAERDAGSLRLANRPEGGLIATIELPVAPRG